MVVARQAARIRSAVVRHRRTRIRCHDIGIKVNQPLARDASVLTTYSMCGVAGRARKPIINMSRVLAEAGIRENLIQIMALGAQRVRPIHGQIWAREQVSNQLAGRRGLAEFIVTFEQVQILRSVRTVRAAAAEFPIVVAVVAVRAEDAVAHVTSGRGSIQIQHLGAQTRLWQRTASVVSDRVARSGGGAELRDDVQGITGGCDPHRQISEFCVRRFSGAGPVAAQAIFVLVNGRGQNRLPV